MSTLLLNSTLLLPSLKDYEEFFRYPINHSAEELLWAFNFNINSIDMEMPLRFVQIDVRYRNRCSL